MRLRYVVSLFSLGILISACVSWSEGRANLPNVPISEQTPLDRYIAKSDPEFAWSVLKTIPGEKATTFILEVTSQKWRSEKEVTQPIWRHTMSVVVPQGANSADTAFLYIGGGSSKDGMPMEPSQRATEIALATQTVAAELNLVPNQPLFFTDSLEQARYEDDIIAYSRVKYMDTGDETWPVRLAMVKSAIRAMDAIQEFAATPEAGELKVEKFVVAGASKRGWTTWLTGVEDTRVVAIIPIVIDALNSQEITKHHYEAYGFFSRALEDYVKHGIFPHRIGTPAYDKALAIEDPKNYFGRERLKIPKYIVNSAGDEFFLPDNSQFYWGPMPEPKRLRYVPNTKHSLAGSDARESIETFYQTILKGEKLPSYSWTKQPDGSLVVSSPDKPREVNLWQATNPGARDFRLDVIGKAYRMTKLQSQPDGTWIGKVDAPAKGYSAFFVELVFESGERYPYKFTTEVSVVPDILPYNFEDALKMKEVPMK